MDLDLAKGFLQRAYGLTADEIAFLREGGAYSYLVSASGRKYLLKLIKPAFSDTAASSLSVMRYLADRGFPAQSPAMTLGGALCEPVEADGARYLGALLPYIEGREPALGECAAAIGRMTAAFHQLMEGFAEALPERGRDFFVERYLRVLEQKRCPRETIAAYRALGDALYDRVSDLPLCRCHGDAHRGNMLLSPDGSPWLLDFDTVCVASPIFDVAVYCDSTDYFHYRPEDFARTQAVCRDFLSGYEAVRALSDREKAALYAMIPLRHFQLQATIAGIYGLDSFDLPFIDRQLEWLHGWLSDCQKGGLL